MGSVALLSREGEIEIAKRIEEGKKDIASVIYGMPMTIEFVLALCDQLKNGTIDVREIVPIVETEEEFEEEQIQRDYEELAGEDARRAESVRKISTSLKVSYEVARHTNSDPAKQKKIKKQIDTMRRSGRRENGIRQSAWRAEGSDGAAGAGVGDSDPDSGARNCQLPAAAWDQR